MSEQPCGRCAAFDARQAESQAGCGNGARYGVTPGEIALILARMQAARTEQEQLDARAWQEQTGSAS